MGPKSLPGQLRQIEPGVVELVPWLRGGDEFQAGQFRVLAQLICPLPDFLRG